MPRRAAFAKSERGRFAVIPVLSIVIASLRPGPVIFECLTALERQRHDGIEVLVVDGSCDDTAARIADRFGWVRVIDVREARSLPRLRGLGIAESSAPIVAILDAWCLVNDAWIAGTLRSHAERPELVIGGGVTLDDRLRRRWQAWISYLYDYWEYVTPFPEGVAQALPGNNIAYKRSALPDAITLREHGFWKAFVNVALREHGQQLWASAGMSVALSRPIPFAKFLRSRFHHGRSYAAMRVATVPAARRTLFALATPLLPGLLLARQTRALVAKPAARWWFVCLSPALLLLQVAWAIGECVGYAFGPGTSHDAIRS